MRSQNTLDSVEKSNDWGMREGVGVGGWREGVAEK